MYDNNLLFAIATVHVSIGAPRMCTYTSCIPTFASDGSETDNCKQSSQANNPDKTTRVRSSWFDGSTD